MHIVLLTCPHVQIAFLKFTSCDNQVLVGCILIPAVGQSSHKTYSNNIVNFQESTTILNACTKVWKLIEYSTYIFAVNKDVHAFAKVINSKVNVIAQTAFEFAYSKAAVLYFNHNATVTHSEYANPDWIFCDLVQWVNVVSPIQINIFTRDRCRVLGQTKKGMTSSYETYMLFHVIQYFNILAKSFFKLLSFQKCDFKNKFNTLYITNIKYHIIVKIICVR